MRITLNNSDKNDPINDTKGYSYPFKESPSYFCTVYDYVGKADLSKGYWNPKAKFGVVMHFPEITKQQ